jgi:hypothetical protein
MEAASEAVKVTAADVAACIYRTLRTAPVRNDAHCSRGRSGYRLVAAAKAVVTEAAAAMAAAAGAKARRKTDRRGMRSVGSDRGRTWRRTNAHTAPRSYRGCPRRYTPSRAAKRAAWVETAMQAGGRSALCHRMRCTARSGTVRSGVHCSPSHRSTSSSSSSSVVGMVDSNARRAAYSFLRCTLQTNRVRTRVRPSRWRA